MRQNHGMHPSRGCWASKQLTIFSRGWVMPAVISNMHYDGPNPELVIPVVNLAFNDFKPATAPAHELDGHNVEYLTDLNEARDSCFDHGDIHRAFPISDRGLDWMDAEEQHRDSWRENGINWSNLQEHMLSSQAWTAKTKFWDWEPRVVGQIASEGRKVIGQKIRNVSQLAEDESEEIGDSIADMLTSIAHARAIRGATSEYWETMLRFLQHGFWVCGFSGTWPDSGRYRLWYPVK